jgi:hypothetical protein
MAYTINRYNNATLTVVEDGTIDQTTDLKLVGKNYAGYGEIQNENFVFLLENFNGANPPPKALSGQVWFDSGNSKLKFYDGTKWRTTGGAEIAASQPAGLSVGDFWWDTTNQQLYAYNGTDFVLVGPQDAGEGLTQMQSRSIRDTDGFTRNIITGTINDEVIFVISAYDGNNGAGFTIDSSDAENAISGFDLVHPGLTLKNTINTTNGVTSTSHRFWGTARSAEGLVVDGTFAPANTFVRTGGVSTEFDSLTNFASDAGIAIGNGLDLKLFVENDNEGVIANAVGSKLKLRATSGGLFQNIIEAEPGKILPGRNNAGTGVNSIDLGQVGSEFNNIHSTTFTGTATQANTLVVSGTARTGAVADSGVSANTVAVRDGSGNLHAVLFDGTATSAQYADLAEKYTTGENELPAGTAVAVCPDECCEVHPAGSSELCIGVVSTAPALMMNSDAEGQYIGLKGRLPVRIKGAVKKGQAVYAWADGICSTVATSALIGIALESSTDEEEKLIECVLKV